MAVLRGARGPITPILSRQPPANASYRLLSEERRSFANNRRGYAPEPWLQLRLSASACYGSCSASLRRISPHAFFVAWPVDHGQKVELGHDIHRAPSCASELIYGTNMRP